MCAKERLRKEIARRREIVEAAERSTTSPVIDLDG
jgi:hypothetical protein